MTQDEADAIAGFGERVFGGFLFVFGLLMCSTFIGAVIGIPMALIGWGAMTGQEMLGDE